MSNPNLKEFCTRVANISSRFECQNNELKKKYIASSIDKINKIMQMLPGYKGSFGTGYPFYVLGKDYEGDLPIIQEQLNYNNLLISEAYKSMVENWVCADCLDINGKNMIDLKVNCKPCPRIESSLKPRKVINRICDLDMWLVVDDDYYDAAKIILAKFLIERDIKPSDIDIMKTIDDVESIVNSIDNGLMPDKMLPVDIHIVRYSDLKSLIESAPEILIDDFEKGIKPYLPINPVSWRKRWQHDDEAYNFIFDFLCSMTPFNFEDELLGSLIESRNRLTDAFSNETLSDILDSIMPDSTKRRFETKQLRRIYEKRIEGWKQE